MAVRKLINATLVMNKIGMEGVLSCRTSYVKNSNQRICHIEVTDQLANLLDNSGLVLKGPICSLTFRLKSGADEEPDEDLILPESLIQPIPILDDVEMLESGSAGGSMLCGTPDDRVLDSSADTLTQPKSPTNSVSSTLSILSQVKSLVVSPPVDSPNRYAGFDPLWLIFQSSVTIYF